MKDKIKRKSILLFKKFLSHDDTAQLFSKLVRQNTQKIAIKNNASSPYYEYLKSQDNTSQRDDIVFITGRFRSGSSVFWNVFRAQQSCTAYYEPLNERRWFDSAARGDFVDSSHLGVQDYWKEYNGLESLDKYYNEDWIRHALHMDENDYDPGLRTFINTLIENASNHPVLQFNRVDFRLPWLRKQYPNAKYLHIYRNPRDQWLSFLTNKVSMNAKEVMYTYKDAFYLDTWCRDLVKQFPFLSSCITPHPYMRFYYLWKLSYLYGKEYCDYSISLEKLTESPVDTLNEIKNLLNWKDFRIDKSVEVIQPIELNKWTKYADVHWFEEKEGLCEAELNNFLNNK